MFLHLRAAAEDFLEVLKEQHSSMPAGVVHSFDGSASELQSLLSFPNVYIGKQLLCSYPAKRRCFSDVQQIFARHSQCRDTCAVCPRISVSYCRGVF